MDWQDRIRELKAAMYPENRYLQNKICVHLENLKNKKDKEVATEAAKLLERAYALKEPYDFDKKLVRPENIGPLLDVYEETILLIENNLL